MDEHLRRHPKTESDKPKDRLGKASHEVMDENPTDGAFQDAVENVPYDKDNPSPSETIFK